MKADATVHDGTKYTNNFMKLIDSSDIMGYTFKFKLMNKIKETLL